MEEDKEKQDKFQTEDLKEMVENRLKEFSIEDVNPDNLDILYKLVDIHKDLANEEYWKIKKEVYKNEIRKLQ
jgi:hypothetical protein